MEKKNGRRYESSKWKDIRKEMSEKKMGAQRGKRIAAGLIAAMMFLLAVVVDIPVLYANEKILHLVCRFIAVVGMSWEIHIMKIRKNRKIGR